MISILSTSTINQEEKQMDNKNEKGTISNPGKDEVQAKLEGKIEIVTKVDKNKLCENSIRQENRINNVVCNPEKQQDVEKTDYSEGINYNLYTVMFRTINQQQYGQSNTIYYRCENYIEKFSMFLTNDHYRFDYNTGIIYVNDSPKINFLIDILDVYLIYDDLKQAYVNKKVNLSILVYTYNSIYPFNLFVDLDEARNGALLNRIPEARSYCKKPNELNEFMYTYINNLLHTCQKPPITKYTLPGWKIDRKVYVTADFAIGRDDLLCQTINMNINNNKSELHLWNNFGGLIYPEYVKMCYTIKENAKMKVLLIYLLASFLHSVFNVAGFGIKHLLFIVGPRGCKKTSIAQCFTQFGENKNTIKHNFESSDSGLQNNFMDFTDQVMLIDDFAPSMLLNKKNSREGKLEMLLRLCGDSGSRTINTSFMKSGAQNIDYTIRGGVVITGEYFYGTGSESSIARAVVIQLSKDSVDDEYLTYFQNNPYILDTFIYRFICFITYRFDGVINQIKQCMQSYRDYSKKYHFSNQRFNDYFSQYMTVGNLLSDFFINEKNCIDKNAFLIELEDDIISVLRENDRNMCQRSPINELLEAIIYELNNGKIGEWGTPFSDMVKLILTDKSVFFRQIDLPDILGRYLAKIGSSAVNINKNTLADLLESHDYCQTYYEGTVKRKGRRYKEYGKTRLMDIPLEKIREFENTHDY